MNAKQLVRLSNIIGVIAILLLIYWVFTFITIEVFGLKVFRENLTQSFYMSIMGILALMVGALIINIMMNLTRIAQRHNDDQPATYSSRATWYILCSLPVLAGLLFLGDHFTSIKKERLLIESAESIATQNEQIRQQIANYSFDKKWINTTSQNLEMVSKIDENFPSVSIIVEDQIAGTPVYLNFGPYQDYNVTDTFPIYKKDFILSTSKSERTYLSSIFDSDNNTERYSSYDGKYELYYPVQSQGRKAILYFSQYQQYGKIGS